MAQQEQLGLGSKDSEILIGNVHAGQMFEKHQVSFAPVQLCVGRGSAWETMRT